MSTNVSLGLFKYKDHLSQIKFNYYWMFYQKVNIEHTENMICASHKHRISTEGAFY